MVELLLCVVIWWATLIVSDAIWRRHKSMLTNHSLRDWHWTLSGKTCLQLRDLLKKWRRGYRRHEVEDPQRSGDAITACQKICALLKEDHTHIETFLSEDGPVVAFEMLQDPCTEKVISTHALSILRALCLHWLRYDRAEYRAACMTKSFKNCFWGVDASFRVRLSRKVGYETVDLHLIQLQHLERYENVRGACSCKYNQRDWTHLDVIHKQSQGWTHPDMPERFASLWGRKCPCVTPSGRCTPINEYIRDWLSQVL